MADRDAHAKRPDIYGALMICAVEVRLILERTSYRIIVTPPGWLTWGSVRSWQMRDGAQALELWSQPTGRIGVPQLSYAICRGGRCNNCCERPGKRPPHYKQVELQYSGSATVDSGQARSGRLGIVDARPRRVAMATGARSRGATNCC